MPATSAGPLREVLLPWQPRLFDEPSLFPLRDHGIHFGVCILMQISWSFWSLSSVHTSLSLVMLSIVLCCVVTLTCWRWGVWQAWKRQKPSYRLSAEGKTLRFYKSFFAGLRYVLAGPKIVSNLYKQASLSIALLTCHLMFLKSASDPFAIPTCDRNYHVYVSSETHIRELNNASIYDLSFNAAMQEASDTS